MDKVLLALVLLRIYLRCGKATASVAINESSVSATGGGFEPEFDYLLLSSSGLHSASLVTSASSSVGGAGTVAAADISSKSKNIAQISAALNATQIAALQSLSRLPAFRNCVDALRAIPAPELADWLSSDKPELAVPFALWKEKDGGENGGF